MSFPRYPSYKSSGVEWLGEVPEHWEVKRLRFAAELNPSKSEVACLDRETLVSFLPMEAIGDDGTLILDKEKTIGELESGYTYFRDGDVTVAKITPCYENGKGALMRGLTNGIGFGTTELIVARPKPEHVTGPYLHYLFISPDFRSIGESHMYGAGGQKRVPDAFVRNFATAFPPVSEQTAIAAFLDRETGKIDALVAEQRRLMELLKEKRQAVISHAVTQGLNPQAPMKDSGIEWLGKVPKHWRVGKAGFYLTILSGYAFGSSGFTDVDSNPKLLRGINVGVSRLKWDETVFWERKPDDGLDLYEMKEGDLVIGMDRPLIAEGIRVAKVKAADLPCLLLQRVASLKTGSELNADYLLSLLSSEMFVAHFAPETTGVSVPHISPEQIYNFIIPVPPLAEQKAIVAHLEVELGKFDTLTAEAQRAIDLLQERRTALISAAVTGQIDVREAVAAR
jgi:type I restriction enzyme S subunit